MLSGYERKIKWVIEVCFLFHAKWVPCSLEVWRVLYTRKQKQDRLWFRRKQS